jgi:GntR family transcriptional regulator, transcriptional repressor for pyruvate dehydrogenase complex
LTHVSQTSNQVVMESKSKHTPDPVFRPIRLERVAEKIAGQLKKAISNGVFKVGNRLPSERELAEQMGVSRTSVREAIQQLELQGIVETVHGGGSLVRNLTEQEIRSPMEIVLEQDKERVLELTEVRAFMEAWAAKQAAAHRTDEELELIRGYIEEMEHDLEKGQIRPEIDFKFHAEIAAATHNTVFVHLIQNIHQLISYSIKVHREEVFLSREDQEAIFRHHLQVFKAIQRRDPAAAEAAMSEHLLFVVREFKQRFLPG